MKKRLVLRRQMGRIEPPKPYLYKDEMPRVRWVYFRYRFRCAAFIMRAAYAFADSGVEDAGYCLDSQVDTEMRDHYAVDVAVRDFPRDHLPNHHVRPKTVQDSRETPPEYSAANAFIGGSRSTVPRDPNYRPGSFGGGWNRAGRGRF